jgi:DNA-binding transcriptional ArsR family regulator
MIDANRIHRALANPLRRDILAWLKNPRATFPKAHIDVGHGVPVNVIQALSGLSQASVSAHVAVLVEAKLLIAARVGQWVFLSRNEETIRAFAKHVALQL